MQEFMWVMVGEIEREEFDQWKDIEIICIFYGELDALRYSNKYREYHVKKIKVMKGESK